MCCLDKDASPQIRKMKSFSACMLQSDVMSLRFSWPSFLLPGPAQLETLKEQNSKYQEELSLSKERSSSENQRIGVLCKEM